MELLSPAGSYESLIAAVQSGADAVYLGGAKFGARQSAANFEIAEMKKWTDYCHLYGVKVYVTVNTLVKDSEIDELAEYVRSLNDVGVDGVLVQDFGVLNVIRSVAPGLPVHASTQMTVTSLEDVRFLENQGFTRVVLSRELSFDEIKRICRNTECEIEVFVHGALCMSYSGQCLMSSILGGRSGNRGRCAQPCRLPYSVDGTDKTGFLLSPKDLCLINSLKELKEAGVASLKIEGRLKRAGYVSTVVGIYRKCLDSCEKASSDDIKRLKDAFGRGFTKGFFGGETGRRMMNLENSSNAADNVFTDEALERCRENADFRKVDVTLSATAKIGEHLVVTMVDSDGHSVVEKSDVLCEKAKKSPTGGERLTASLTKLGGTPYRCIQADVTIDEDAVIPVSAVNAVRRRACEALNRLRTFREIAPTYQLNKPESVAKQKKIQLICEVMNREQYEAVKNAGIDEIIAPSGIVGDGIVKCPGVSKSGCSLGGKLYVSSIGQIDVAYGAELIGSHRLNITNSYSADFYSAYLKKSVLSCELSLREIRDLTSNTELECGSVVYGRLDLMLCANCPLKSAGVCQNGEMKYSLKDRKGEAFPVVCAENCAVRILNSKPLYMADKWNDLIGTGLSFGVLVFTDESPGKCAEIVKTYLDAAKGISAPSMKENTFTRGHFYRGIL